jgi:ribosome-binding protein aMBF1 (putative translation factor)/Zn-dependent peptidase ImmA (M78 family)
MIKNERQYKITKAQVDRFEQSLQNFEETTSVGKKVHPLILKAQQDALRSQLDELQEDLREYEALRSGERTVLPVETFEELPRALIKARIACGLSQKDLAERLGMKEQQVQRYESSDYASASMERVKEVIKALGIHVREDIYIPLVKISPSVLFRRLNELGLKRDLVLNRLLPKTLSAYLREAKDKNGQDQSVLHAATIIARMLGLSTADILGSGPLDLQTATTGTVRFNIPGGRSEKQVRAYTMYAHYLALLTLQATADLPSKPIPTQSDEVRRAISANYGEITFENTLKYVWDLGVPVLPLRDPAVFHGACFRDDGRNVIVLKQKTISESRWEHDLLHELLHAGQEPDKPQRDVIEDSITSEARRKTPEEEMCSEFAGEVSLDGRPEELLLNCIEATKRRPSDEGSVELLKSVVPYVAEKAKVSVGALANYIAFRLWQDEIANWWPTAANLQETNDDPWRIARDIFIERVNFGYLNNADRELLQQALAEAED